MILNIHGFTMDKFSELLQSVFHVYDFVCQSQTWMNLMTDYDAVRVPPDC